MCKWCRAVHIQDRHSSTGLYPQLLWNQFKKKKRFGRTKLGLSQGALASVWNKVIKLCCWNDWGYFIESHSSRRHWNFNSKGISNSEINGISLFTFLALAFKFILGILSAIVLLLSAVFLFVRLEPSQSTLKGLTWSLIELPQWSVQRKQRGQINVKIFLCDCLTSLKWECKIKFC